MKGQKWKILLCRSGIRLLRLRWIRRDKRGDPDLPRYRRAVEARRLVRDIRIPKDIIVLMRGEWERELGVPSSLSSTVQREGIRLAHG